MAEGEVRVHRAVTHTSRTEALLSPRALVREIGPWKGHWLSSPVSSSTRFFFSGNINTT